MNADCQPLAALFAASKSKLALHWPPESQNLISDLYCQKWPKCKAYRQADQSGVTQGVDDQPHPYQDLQGLHSQVECHRGRKVLPVNPFRTRFLTKNEASAETMVVNLPSVNSLLARLAKVLRRSAPQPPAIGGLAHGLPADQVDQLMSAESAACPSSSLTALRIMKPITLPICNA